MSRTDYLVKAWCTLVFGLVLIFFVTPWLVINYGQEWGSLLICGVVSIVVSGLIFLAVNDEDKKAKAKLALALNLNNMLQKREISEGVIDIEYLAKELNISLKVARQKVLKLIKTGRILGSLGESSNNFLPTGDVPQIIDTLILDLQKK